jgi:serine/threonine-protein phosphatase CPPED1
VLRIVLALLLAVSAGWAEEKPFFFVQLADPQFGMFTNNRDFEQETANFEFVVATINRVKPAFVVVCGDLVHKPDDAAQIAEYKRIVAKVDPAVLVYDVAGNHDVENEPTPQSLAAYRAKFGRDYYSFRYGNMAGIVLNSSIIHSPQHVPNELEQQEVWLRAELERARSEGVRHLVIFQHHPWFLSEPGEKDQYFNIPLERRTRYLELFQQYGVTHVFAGHYHRNALGRDGSLEMVTSEPVGRPLGKDGSGIRVVTVRDSGIEHRYYELGFLPSRVVLDEKQK